MGQINKLKWCIICFSVLIALLSFTKYYKDWEQEKEKVNANFASSPFYLAHVLDPASDGYQFTSWTRQQWIDWLARRATRYKKAAPYRKPLIQKGLNSVIIATPSQVINAFENRRYPYIDNDAGSSSNDQDSALFWSESLFHSYIFERQGSVLRIFRCPPMYIAVAIKLNNGLPTHLHEHSKKRLARSYKVKVKKDCEEITN